MGAGVLTLVAALTPAPVLLPGKMEYTLAVVASLAGLQEVEPGWVLANGVVLPAGTKYDALRTILGTSHGANGTLPTLIDGVVPLPRGGSLYPTLGVTDGAAAVTLTLAQIWNHAHTWTYESTATPDANGFANYGSSPPFDDGGYEGASSANAAGGGGSHNNMPPYVVVEGMMIKL